MFNKKFIIFSKSTVVALIILFSIQSIPAQEISYEDALDIALNRSSRGEIIRGNLEVAEKNYFAKRVSFWVPEISIRGSVPAYESNEDYTYLPGTDQKVLGKRTTVDWDSYINLDQNLISGGKLTFQAFLRSNNWEYPQQGVIIDEQRRLGSFNLTLDQPILKPSDPKNELNNKKDDYEIARITKQEETASLMGELTEAYFGVLQMTLHKQIASEKLESAKLKTGIDSIKFLEEVISEEDWLISSSERLDAELEQFDIENNLTTKRRDLAMILDLEINENLVLSPPKNIEELTPEKSRLYLASADNSNTVKKAEHEYKKAQRSSRYEASSKGLTGTLTANYSKESGRVEITLQDRRDLNLNTYGIKLEFNYPLWDGGASGASVQAAQLQAEQSRIEYEKALKSSRSEIESLINSVNISSKKLKVLKQQIDLAKNRRDIADFRFKDGQISKITYFE
ncbi:MAG: TolC family protein, partial [bacterium]